MIVDRLYAWARIQPDKTALIQNAVPISYARFARGIERTRKFLERQRLPERTVAAVLIDDLSSCWTVGIALRAIGLDTVAAHNARQAQDLALRNLSCFVLLEGDDDAERTPPPGMRLVSVPRALYVDLDHDELPAPIEAGSRYGGHIIYTSGTTGSYKKIMMPAALEDERNARRGVVYGLTRDFVINSIAYRMSTSAGFKLPAAAWHGGATAVFDQTPDWAANLFKFNVSRITILPSHLARIFPSQTPRDVPPGQLSQGIFTFAGGFLAPPYAERIVRELTPRLTLNYTSSEMTDIALSSDYRTADDLQWLRVADGNRVEIVDENGGLCGPGQEGRLRIALKETDSSGYMDDETATRQAFQDGCFYPGDHAVTRSDGRVRILGRVQDVINLRGEKFAVAPIEQDLRDYLKADDVCLFLHVDDRGEERLFVAVQASSPPSQEQVDGVRQEFGFVPHVDIRVLPAFPRTESGKVQRATLSALLRRTLSE
jgi:acyl-coenzyme A synthetase/AMP-(fatty) acid ligase